MTLFLVHVYFMKMALYFLTSEITFAAPVSRHACWLIISVLN